MLFLEGGEGGSYSNVDIGVDIGVRSNFSPPHPFPQASQHPLLGPLMTCMASLLRDHKAEIEDILAGDKQLARELVFDMKQVGDVLNSNLNLNFISAYGGHGPPSSVKTNLTS